MIVIAVALVLTALVVAVVLVSGTFRAGAYCPRREALVEIIDGRCQYRGTCASAPIGCERECLKIRDLAAHAT